MSEKPTLDELLKNVTLQKEVDWGSPYGGWQDISTAPKDGRRIDLWQNGRRVTDAFWDDGEEWWCIDSRYSDGEPCPVAISPEPSHWRDLPPPPTQDA